MFNLPIEIQRRIYEYDPTYKTIMNNIIKNDIPDYKLKQHPNYLYLLDFFQDIHYDFDNAMYYYSDNNGEPQVSYIDDDINNITNNFSVDGDAILYQGTDITYLLEPYMVLYESNTESDTDTEEAETQFFMDLEDQTLII
jgi:hypothetical protein